MQLYPVRPSHIEHLEARQLLAAAPGFAESVFATGLSSPTAFAFAPDGRLFVAQQRGELRVIKGGLLLQDAALSLDVASEGERGLIGIALDPAFADNGLVYVHYTTKTPDIHNRVSRFTLAGDTIDPASEQVLIDLPNLSAATNHNGGAIHFGADGKLYIGVGDNNNPSNAQPLTTPLGKMLRLNPDGTIPADNPFFNETTGQNQAIWARGLRNPYTFAVRSDGRIHINDVGQSTFEEINVGSAGANFGWPIIEGNRTNETAPDGYVDPLFGYGRNGPVSGAAIAGGTFYETPSGVTSAFPASLEGDYLFSDWGSGFVHSIDPGSRAISSVASGLSGPVDLTVGPDGAIYALEYFTGRVTRFAASAAADLSVAISTTPPPQAVHGSVSRARLQIQNAGGSLVRGKITVRLLASIDNVADAADVVLAEASRSIRLDVGKSRPMNLRFAYPDSLDGSFFLLADVASTDGQIAEQTLSNNTAASAEAVEVSAPQMDLSASFQQSSVILSRATRSRLLLNVANQGNINFGQRVQITLSLQPATGTTVEVAILRRRLTLAAGGSKTVALRLRAPVDLLAGTYTLSAELEATGSLADVDTTNNQAILSAVLS